MQKEESGYEGKGGGGWEKRQILGADKIDRGDLFPGALLSITELENGRNPKFYSFRMKD